MIEAHVLEAAEDSAFRDWYQRYRIYAEKVQGDLNRSVIPFMPPEKRGAFEMKIRSDHEMRGMYRTIQGIPY